MGDWKLFLECVNGHRFGVEVVCPTCDQVVAEHLHKEPPAPRKPTWWERRAMRQAIKRFERGE